MHSLFVEFLALTKNYSVDFTSMTEDFFADKAKHWDESPFKIELIKKLAGEVRARYKIGSETVVMDFGCGTGLVGLNFINECKSVVFVDNSPAMLAVLSEKLQKLAGKVNFEVWGRDVREYEGQKVDLVVSNNVLHHTVDVPATIAGVYRAMNEGGHVVFVDLKTEDGTFHAPEVVPHNGFDPEEMKTIFEGTGFKNVQVSDYDTMKKPGGGSDKIFGRWFLTADK